MKVLILNYALARQWKINTPSWLITYKPGHVLNHTLPQTKVDGVSISFILDSKNMVDSTSDIV